MNKNSYLIVKKTIRRLAVSEIQKEQTLEEKWENATIANNFIFYKVIRRGKPAVLL